MQIEDIDLLGFLGEGARISYLCKGQIGKIYQVDTEGKRYILKTSQSSNHLVIEARMLSDLERVGIRVPCVHYVSPEYLLMERIREVVPTQAERDRFAADALIRLHSTGNENRMYGYYYDTTIASFVQHNEQTQYNWGLFLGQMRIIPMVRECYDRGTLDGAPVGRLERLSRDIYKLIDLSEITPSLLHGDLWSGNVLFDDKGAVLIDPAIYFGDREMELAFIRMFDTFSEVFWRRYTAHFPLSSTFASVKLPLYQIYPILVHIALYGAQYRGALERSLKELNY